MAATGCLTKLEPYPYSNLPAVHVYSLFVTSYQYLSNEINHTINVVYELYDKYMSIIQYLITSEFVPNSYY